MNTTRFDLQQVKLLIFDIGNTLVDANWLISSSAKYAADVLASMDLIDDSSLLLESYLTASANLTHEHINRIFSDMLIVSKAMEIAGISCSEQTRLLFLTFFRRSLRDKLTRDERLVSAMSTFKSKGLLLAVISDGITIEQYELLEKIGIIKLIDIIVVSETFGAEKVSTAIFEHTVNRASLRPEDAVMIGDDIERDMQHAHRAGLKTVLQVQYVQPEPEVVNKHSKHIGKIINNVDDLLPLLGD